MVVSLLKPHISERQIKSLPQLLVHQSDKPDLFHQSDKLDLLEVVLSDLATLIIVRDQSVQAAMDKVLLQVSTADLRPSKDLSMMAILMATDKVTSRELLS